MTAQRILIVEDEPDIRELLALHLAKEGFVLSAADTGEKALEMASCENFDGILLDLVLPKMDGLDLLKRLKSHSRTRGVPVVIVSARAEDADIVIGLELGAEDYVTKPFSPTVVVSRLKAAIRRRSPSAFEEMPVIRLRSIQINPGRRQVMAGKQSVSLTPSEFAILHLLARRPGWVFSRPQILDSLHGSNYEVSERSVDYVIASLRRKLGAHSDEIQTVRGVGYRAILETDHQKVAD